VKSIFGTDEDIVRTVTGTPDSGWAKLDFSLKGKFKDEVIDCTRIATAWSACRSSVSRPRVRALPRGRLGAGKLVVCSCTRAAFVA
jgi:hypothetical protein